MQIKEKQIILFFRCNDPVQQGHSMSSSFSSFISSCCRYVCVWFSYRHTAKVIGQKMQNIIVFWFLYANKAAESQFITQSKWCPELSLPFIFFFYFQFIVSLKNVVKSVNYWVSFLLDCVQRALKYLGLNPPLQNYFDLEKAPPPNSSLSCLWSNIRHFSS